MSHKQAKRKRKWMLIALKATGMMLQPTRGERRRVYMQFVRAPKKAVRR